MLVFGILIPCVLIAGPALARTPTDEVRAIFAEANRALTDPVHDDNPAERVRGLLALVDRVIAFPDAAALALGREWGRRSSAERAAFLPLFTDLVERSLVMTVASKARLEPGIALEYGEERADGRFGSVLVTIAARNGSHLPVEFRMVRRGEGWAIRDVVLDGISFIGTYHAQFVRVMRASSFAGLIALMRSRSLEASEWWAALRPEHVRLAVEPRAMREHQTSAGAPAGPVVAIPDAAGSVSERATPDATPTPRDEATIARTPASVAAHVNGTTAPIPAVVADTAGAHAASVARTPAPAPAASSTDVRRTPVSPDDGTARTTVRAFANPAMRGSTTAVTPSEPRGSAPLQAGGRAPVTPAGSRTEARGTPPAVAVPTATGSPRASAPSRSLSALASTPAHQTRSSETGDPRNPSLAAARTRPAATSARMPVEIETTPARESASSHVARSDTRPAASRPLVYWVQVGAFAEPETASRLVEKLRAQDRAVNVSQADVRVGDAETRLTRVRVGPFADRAAAVTILRELQRSGYAPFVAVE